MVSWIAKKVELPT